MDLASRKLESFHMAVLDQNKFKWMDMEVGPIIRA